MPRKHFCSCGAPQYRGESVTYPHSDEEGGIHHEFQEKFGVWICEFCGREEKTLSRATRRSKGIRRPRETVVREYAPVLSKIPENQDHVRARTFFGSLESCFGRRNPNEALEELLFESVVEVEYTMKNARRDEFVPVRVRLNPDFEGEIREILEECKGIEPVESKIGRVEQILSSVDFSRATNPQTKRILSILRVQKSHLSNGEIPYFELESRRCQIRKDNDRYEILLRLLVALLENVRKENIIVSSDLCQSVGLDGNCVSEYGSDLERVLNARRVLFGILRKVKPIYIPPSRIPKEVRTEIELFETDIREFAKANLLSFYASFQTVISVTLKNIFPGKAWGRINRRMIDDMESDYEKTNDSRIKSAITAAKRCRPYDQLLFDRFFEAMVMADLIAIIDHEWNTIFSKEFHPLQKDDVLTKLRTVKQDRNIKSHPKSRIPTTFKTLTHIFEFQCFFADSTRLTKSYRGSEF